MLLIIIRKINLGILGENAHSFPPPGGIRFGGKSADNAVRIQKNNKPGNPGKNCT